MAREASNPAHCGNQDLTRAERGYLRHLLEDSFLLRFQLISSRIPVSNRARPLAHRSIVVSVLTLLIAIRESPN